MKPEKPKDDGRTVELMNEFLNSEFPSQPLHPRRFLEYEREFGIEMRDLIDGKDLPSPIDASLRKSLETTQTLMFELVDKTRMYSSISKEVKRLIKNANSKDQAKISERFAIFYQLISKSSTFVLSITLHLLSMCNSYKEVLDLLDALLYKNPGEDFSKMLRFANNEKIYTEPETPLSIYLYSIVPMDISGIYAGKTNEELMSAWKNRISFCIGLVNHLSEIRDVLSNSKKNKKNNREG